MTIRQFYDETGGNYDSVIQRFLTEERTKRFLKMFLKDPSYEQLESSLKTEDVDEAFLAAHTLKGVCLNIGLSRLYTSSSDVTEALRGRDLNAAMQKMQALRRDYMEVMNGIGQIPD